MKCPACCERHVKIPGDVCNTCIQQIVKGEDPEKRKIQEENKELRKEVKRLELIINLMEKAM